MDTTEQRFRALLSDAFDHLPSPPTPGSIEARAMRPVRRPSRRRRFVAIGALTAGAIAVVFVVIAAATGNDNTSTQLDTSGTVVPPPSTVVVSTAASSAKVLRTLTVDGETWRFVDDAGCLKVLDPAGQRQVDACSPRTDFYTSAAGSDYKGVYYYAVIGIVPANVTRVELEMSWGATLTAIPTDRIFVAVTQHESFVPGSLSDRPPVAVTRYFTAQGLLCTRLTGIFSAPTGTGAAPSCPVGVPTTTK